MFKAIFEHMANFYSPDDNKNFEDFSAPLNW